MSRDPAQHWTDLITNVTILQLQTDLVLRRLRRHDSLSEDDRQWLEIALVTLRGTTRELASLIVGDEEPRRNPDLQPRALPRLIALPPRHNRN